MSQKNEDHPLSLSSWGLWKLKWSCRKVVLEQWICLCIAQYCTVLYQYTNLESNPDHFKISQGLRSIVYIENLIRRIMYYFSSRHYRTQREGVTFCSLQVLQIMVGKHWRSLPRSCLEYRLERLIPMKTERSCCTPDIMSLYFEGLLKFVRKGLVSLKNSFFNRKWQTLLRERSGRIWRWDKQLPDPVWKTLSFPKHI